jgi:ATP-dependent DNA helicase PIF1
LPYLTAASYDPAPLSKFNNSQALLSLSFPGLFPFGLAKFTTPRIRGIKYPLFVRHLFLYKDGQFQRHPRFRYVIFNTIMREQVNTKASFFVNKINPQQKDLSLDNLRQAFEDDSPESAAILNSITRHAGSLAGTRPFWAGKRHGLESMVQQLGCPGVFITVSYADYHWHSLFKHMPPDLYQQWQNGTPNQRIRLSRNWVRDNPAVVAYHFHRQLKVFRSTVLSKKFCIDD